MPGWPPPGLEATHSSLERTASIQLLVCGRPSALSGAHKKGPRSSPAAGHTACCHCHSIWQTPQNRKYLWQKGMVWDVLGKLQQEACSAQVPRVLEQGHAICSRELHGICKAPEEKTQVVPGMRQSI